MGARRCSTSAGKEEGRDEEALIKRALTVRGQSNRDASLSGVRVLSCNRPSVKNASPYERDVSWSASARRE
jgi:hypothetical protein